MHKLSNDLRRRVVKAIEYPFVDKRTDKSLLIALHGEVFSSSLCKTCENEQILAYIQLTRLIKPKKMNSQNPPSKNYRFNPLHEDKTVSLKGVRGQITALNLTDETAKRIIKQVNTDDLQLVVTVEEAESIRKQMESAPKNEDGSVDYASMKVAELKSLLDASGVDYGDAKKAELVALAEEKLG